jgi:mannose-1-phosphate guanylyltransferase
VASSTAKHVYAVILAGGSGTRFWPRSRHLRPKQLCRIGSGESTMIETTLRRIEGFIPSDRRMIVTHQDQLDLTRQVVGPACPKILAEPEARNTAAALAMAALELLQHDPNAVMVSLHADHVIRNEEQFKQDLLSAIQVAEAGFLTLVGIRPMRPETGYGYIEKGSLLTTPLAGFKVKKFREKPDRATAESYLASGNFLWNSGLFVWKASRIVEEFQQFLPQTVQRLSSLLHETRARSFTDVPRDRLSETYALLQKIAIDNAILEVSQSVAVVESDCGWFDVGSWDSLADCFGADHDGNYLRGDVLLMDTKNCTVDSDGTFVATLGIRDLVVVAQKDAIMVCPKDRAQDVKLIVDELKKQGRKNLT